MASAKEQIIAAAAAQNKVPARLLYGVWGAESNYGKNKSTSPAGAEGDFQFEPGTARSLGVNVNSFSSSAYGAAKYLAQLRKGSSSWHEAIAKYNAGPAGNLDNPETAAYVPKVFALSKGYGGPSAQSQLAGKLAGLGTTTSTTFDRAGFDQANKRSVLANFLSTQKGAGQNPLLTTGLLVPGRAPQKSDFTTSRTVTTPGALSGGAGRYVDPFGASLKAPGRVDEGVDPTIHGAIRAIGNARVVNISHNFYKGQPYVVYQLTDGPHAGKYVYVSELITPHVKVGDRVRAGQQIATGHGAIETGWAGGPQGGYLPLANRAQGGNYTEGKATSAGRSFASFLRRLGAQADG